MLRITLLIQLFLAINQWMAAFGVNHRCYVCVPSVGSSISDVLQMFPENTIIPLCNQFQTDNPEYIQECPSSNYQGCLTQTNGTHVTKTCTDLGIEDCKTANKIKYCYCKDFLCNNEPIPTEITDPSEMEDDEDSHEEGSGTHEEASESSEFETSSEPDHGIEIVQNMLPTTTKSVILTTTRPDGAVTRSAAILSAQSLKLFYLIISLMLSII